MFLLILAAVLVRVGPRLRRGEAFKLFMAAYLGFRLLVDALKPGVALAAGLTGIQWAAALGLAYYAWWWVARRGLEPHGYAAVEEVRT